MSSSLASTYEANIAKFDAGSAKASSVAEVFGPPALLGTSLDQLRSPSDPSIASIMPGLGLGAPPAGSSLQASSNEAPQYYLAYSDADNRILWFHIKTLPNGDEVVTEHGWRSTS